MKAARPGRRGAAVGVAALVLALATGCAGGDAGAPGSIVVRVEWLDARPAEERLGGFAFFGRATGPDGPGPEGEIRDELPIAAPVPGDYLIEVWVRHESDAVAMEDVPGGTPRVVRTFGQVDSACSAQVAVAPGATIRLVMRATPGNCELVPDGVGGLAPGNSG